MKKKKEEKKALEELLSRGEIWIADASGTPLHITQNHNSTDDSSFILEKLSPGTVHEWTLKNSLSSKKKKVWHPPLFLIWSLVYQIFLNHPKENPPTPIFWIGRHIWPNVGCEPNVGSEPNATDAFLQQCIFIDPPNKKEHLWSITEALKKNSSLCVIADGSSLNFTATRRLQLAAKEGSSLALLLCPPWEITRPSAAHSKWKLNPQASPESELEWLLELSYSRGQSAAKHWTVKCVQGDENEKNTLSFSSCLVSEFGSHQTERAQTDKLRA